jgi:hypothetical protein
VIDPWLASLDPVTLRELASLADRASRPVPIDPERMADELAQMAERGDRPSVGWFKRNYVRPERQVLNLPPKSASVANVACYMVTEGYQPRTVARVVYDAATASGMEHDEAIEATAAGIARARKPARAS